MKNLSIVKMFRVLWNMWVCVRPLRELRLSREQIAKDNFRVNRHCGKYTYMEALKIAYAEREEVLDHVASRIIVDKGLGNLVTELSAAAVWGLPQLLVLIAGIIILIR